MHIITITTLFPNATDRQRAVFVENLVKSLKRFTTVSVISPVPFVPPFLRSANRTKQRGIPSTELIGEIEVTHPRFVVLPKLLFVRAFFYCLSVLPQVRRIVNDRNNCVLHAHFAFPDAVAVGLVSTILGVPFFITAHGSDINVYSKYKLLLPQIRWALRRAHGVIAVSKELQRKVTELIGPGKSAVVQIPCAGFDPRLFCKPPVEIEIVDNALIRSGRVALFVGRLVPIKGVDVLVDAWGILRDRGFLVENDCLVIIGEGELRRALEMRALNANLDGHVRWLGELPHSEIARQMARATILCLGSYNEGTPNVVIEALASGIPVVTTRVGGLPDVVIEGVNGFMVPPGEPALLADGIASAFVAKWNKEAIRESVSHLTWDAIAERNFKFLSGVDRKVEYA